MKKDKECLIGQHLIKYTTKNEKDETILEHTKLVPNPTKLNETLEYIKSIYLGENISIWLIDFEKQTLKFLRNEVENERTRT